MITLVIIFSIVLIIGSIYHQNIAGDLEAAKTERDSEFNTSIASQVIIFASRKSLTLMISVTMFIAVLYVGLTAFIGSDGLIEDIFYYWDFEDLLMLLLPAVIFIPVLVYLIFLIWRVEKAVRSKQIVMDIDNDGFECHSKILGKLRKYNWEDVEQFYPATRRQGAVTSLVIEFKLSGKHNAEFFEDKIGFQTANIDLDIAKFVQYFEHFSGLKAGALKKIWS